MNFTCPADYIAFAHQLADLARPVALGHFRQPELFVEQKHLHDPVTLADRAIETLWREMVQTTYPEHGIWGEEYGKHQTGAEWVWIFDPIDGTKAFTFGRPTFGCLIGLYHQTHGFVLGIVDQPVVEWRWSGIRGQGAVLQMANLQNSDLPNASFNHRILKTQDVPLHDVRIALTNPLRLSPTLKRLRKQLTRETGYMAYGGDCMNYTGLADGGVHAIFDSVQKIYDIAAIIPIIHEAGGVITHLDGSAIDFSEDHTIMAAHTPQLHQELQRRYRLLLDEGNAP